MHLPGAGAVDPTSKILFKHYRDNYSNGSLQSTADLIVNIMFLRNTMSREMVKLCSLGEMPWLKVNETGKLTEESKRACDDVYLKLGGKIFFTGSVEPMKGRSKAPKKGYGELVNELVHFARKAKDLAALWQGPNAVESLAKAIRKISGFGGKGFRMKEIVLDLAEIAGGAGISDQLVDFGVVGQDNPPLYLWLIRDKRN